VEPFHEPTYSSSNELEIPNMKLTIQIARLFTIAACAAGIYACSSSDGDGTGQSAAELCASFCEKTADLDCPNDADDCVADCVSGMDEVPQACRTQIESYGRCAAARPASDFECDGFGESDLKEGICQSQLDAAVECAIREYSSGGGGGAGGGGGEEECPFTNDGECDEPDLCPPGTDTADCEG
jgi:hypothetical protein